MYEKAGVSGPSEFGELRQSDRVFWEGWMQGEAERAKERNEEIENAR